jgi:hypothetical protein
MALNPPYAYDNISINNVTWTDVKAPFPCNGLGIFSVNGIAMLLRTDKTDPTTQKYLAAGVQEGVLPKWQPQGILAGLATFLTGATIVSLLSTQASDVAMVTFLE